MRGLFGSIGTLVLIGSASAQSGFGKLDPTPPSGATVDAIIKRMGEREAEFAAAREQYIYRQTVTFQTISDETNRPDGEYKQVEDITFGKNNQRESHVVFAPQTTLERVQLTPADFRDLEQRLPFVLTTAQLPEYDLTYLGRQKVDEVDTYVFDVKPKKLEKGKRYLQGKAWVDVTDAQIVLINGLNVPQDTRPGHEDLSPPFSTYYEQIDGKYWFPTYTKAEGDLHFVGGSGYMAQDVHVRTIVKYSDYKKFRSTITIHVNGEEIPADSAKKPEESPK